MSINNVVMSGNLTKKPEIRRTGTNMAVVTFNLAVNEWRPGKDGQPGQETTNFFDWVAFGDRWEKIGSFLDKGAVLTFLGKAKKDSYTNKDGHKVYSVNFIVNEIQLPKKPTDTEYYGDKSRGDGGTGSQQLSATLPPSQPVAVYDEDIPF